MELSRPKSKIFLLFFQKKIYIYLSSLEFFSSEFSSLESSLSESSEKIYMLLVINLDVLFSLATHLHSFKNT